METAIGRIFRPETPDEIQESVRLDISDSSIEIEVKNRYFGLEEFQIEIILGVFNGIGNVTLVSCRKSGSEFGGGADIVRFRANFLLKGIHIYSNEGLRFSRCYVNLPSLFEWVKIRSIKDNALSENRILFEIPDDILITSFEKFKLSFSFGYWTKYQVQEIYLKQYTNLKIESIDEDFPISDCIDIINHFKKFLLLVANKSPKSESIVLFNNGYKYEGDEQLISIELLSKPDSDAQLSIVSPRIEFNTVESNIEEIMRSWYEKKNIISSIDLILEKFFNPKLSRENDFLNSCFAIETLHRRVYKTTVFDKSEFKVIKDGIIERIENTGIKSFINEKLSFANEPTFKNRLLDLGNDFKAVLPEEIDVPDYLTKIVKTRNYLVHRGNSRNTFDRFDLLYAARYIESVVRIKIFKELKVPESVISTSQDFIKRHLHELYNFNKRRKASIPNIL